MNDLDLNLLPKNKYFLWYWNICNRAKDRVLEKDIYVEEHHIYPTSIYGNNDMTVRLTGKEHYIVHLLLWWGFRFVYGSKDLRTMKMAFAYTMMSSISKDNKDRYKIKNANEYSLIRMAYSEAVSFNNTGRNKGVARSKETIEKIKATKQKNGTFISEKQRSDISNTLKEYYKSNTMVKKGKTFVEYYGTDRAAEVSKNMSNSAKNKKIIKVMKYRLLDISTNIEFDFIGNQKMFDNFLKKSGDRIYNMYKNNLKKYKIINKHMIKVNKNYEEV